MPVLLMHQDYEVAVIKLSKKRFSRNVIPVSSFVENVQVINHAHLPLMLKYCNESDFVPFLEKWMLSRVVPNKRDGIDDIKKFTGENLLLCSMLHHGNSVSDGYWYKNAEATDTWKSIDCRSNIFSYDIGNIWLGKDIASPNLNTPDLTTNGNAKKTWRRRDGKLFLLKQGTPPYYEEPFNEKIASEILLRFSKVPFVKYDLVKVNEHICSICENFVPDGIDFIPAADLYNTSKKSDFSTPWDHMKERCRTFNIPGYKAFFDTLKILDYLMRNEDRHLGNYGFELDTKTMTFIGPAPIYDNGSSLWGEMLPGTPQETIETAEQEFKKYLQQIRHPEKIDLSRLKGIGSIAAQVYAGSKIPADRIHAICTLMDQRLEVAERGLEHAIKRQHTREDIEL